MDADGVDIALQLYKQACGSNVNDTEGIRKAAAIIHNPLSTALVSIWGTSFVTANGAKPRPNEVPEDLSLDHYGKWVWSFYVVNWEMWCAAAGLPPARSILHRCETLCDTGIVYPDGTVHEWVSRRIRAVELQVYKAGTQKSG
jgi:hypothetical protein